MASVNSKSLARCLEKLEILRSGLRWAPGLEKRAKNKILLQVNSLRNDLMFLSRTGKIKEKAQQEKEKERIPLQQRRRQLLERNFIFEGIFGDNPKLLEVLEILEKAARSDLPVLVGGESGTGKELMAKVVHANSERSGQPFVSVNCGAIPDTLLESELFGHTKGAFTGAIRDRKGKFELANGGTLFLDEVGELSLGNQVKLLRALQSGEIQRVGSEESIFVDARIVAATNRDLLAMLKEATFREDLYYRMSVISVVTPPLRERVDELPLLIQYFINEAAEKLNRQPVRLSSRVQRTLLDYAYPGNIRELQNIIYRLSCLADDEASLYDLPLGVRKGDVESDLFGQYEGSRYESLEQARRVATERAETSFLIEKLKEFNGNVTQLAESLQMNRSYVQKLLKKYSLSSKEYKKKKE